MSSTLGQTRTRTPVAKPDESSAPAMQLDAKEPLMKKDNVKLTEDQEAQLLALENMPDDQVDTSDIPETLDWIGGWRGVFYQPGKRRFTLRLDSDVVEWFKFNAQDNRSYQADINRVLREHMQQSQLEWPSQAATSA